MPPRAGNQDVLDVLPKGPVLFEVDNCRSFVALLVGDKLNSSHV
jgi:hypothetical protein